MQNNGYVIETAAGRLFRQAPNSSDFGIFMSAENARRAMERAHCGGRVLRIVGTITPGITDTANPPKAGAFAREWVWVEGI